MAHLIQLIGKHIMEPPMKKQKVNHGYGCVNKRKREEDIEIQNLPTKKFKQNNYYFTEEDIAKMIERLVISENILDDMEKYITKDILRIID